MMTLNPQTLAGRRNGLDLAFDGLGSRHYPKRKGPCLGPLGLPRPWTSKAQGVLLQPGAIGTTLREEGRSACQGSYFYSILTIHSTTFSNCPLSARRQLQKFWLAQWHHDNLHKGLCSLLPSAWVATPRKARWLNIFSCKLIKLTGISFLHSLSAVGLRKAFCPAIPTCLVRSNSHCGEGSTRSPGKGVPRRKTGHIRALQTHTDHSQLQSQLNYLTQCTSLSRHKLRVVFIWMHTLSVHALRDRTESTAVDLQANGWVKPQCRDAYLPNHSRLLLNWEEKEITQMSSCGRLVKCMSAHQYYAAMKTTFFNVYK